MRLLKWIDCHLEETLLILFLVIICLLSGVQVIMRYVFNNSLTWSEEFCRYTYIWSGFISIAYCVRIGTTIRIDTFVTFLPEKLKRILGIVASAIAIAIFCILFKNALFIVQKTIISGQTSPAIELPMYYVYAAPVVGFALSVIRLAQGICKDSYALLKGGKTDLQGGEAACQ